MKNTAQPRKYPTASACATSDSTNGESFRSRRKRKKRNDTFATRNTANGGANTQRSDVSASAPAPIRQSAVARRATPAKMSGTVPANTASSGVGPMIQLSTARAISPSTGTAR